MSTPQPTIDDAVLTPQAVFQALADSTRLRTLMLLVRERELCVCELTFALRVSQPKMSRHLAVLRETALVADRRDGVWIHYRLADELPAWALTTIKTVSEGCAQDEPFVTDYRRLVAMPDRPGQRCCS